MNFVAILLIGMLVPWAIPTAEANHCATEEDVVAAGLIYVVEEGQYVYMESNGQGGLQRGSTNSAAGKTLGLAGDSGLCSHPDSILF